MAQSLARIYAGRPWLSEKASSRGDRQRKHAVRLNFKQICSIMNGIPVLLCGSDRGNLVSDGLATWNSRGVNTWILITLRALAGCTSRGSVLGFFIDEPAQVQNHRQKYEEIARVPKLPLRTSRLSPERVCMPGASFSGRSCSVISFLVDITIHSGRRLVNNGW